MANPFVFDLVRCATLTRVTTHRFISPRVLLSKRPMTKNVSDGSEYEPKLLERIVTYNEAY